MGGYSIQDLQSRLEETERKLNFVMKTIARMEKAAVSGPDGFSGPIRRTMLDDYNALKLAGLADKDN